MHKWRRSIIFGVIHCVMNNSTKICWKLRKMSVKFAFWTLNYLKMIIFVCEMDVLLLFNSKWSEQQKSADGADNYWCENWRKMAIILRPDTNFRVYQMSITLKRSPRIFLSYQSYVYRNAAKKFECDEHTEKKTCETFVVFNWSVR